MDLDEPSEDQFCEMGRWLKEEGDGLPGVDLQLIAAAVDEEYPGGLNRFLLDHA